VVRPYVKEDARVMPLLRGRVIAVAGRRVQLPTRESIREQPSLTREFGLTFRAGLDANERVMDGVFWRAPLTADRLDAGAETEVAVERRVARNARIEPGDLMTFDIAGRTLVARVTSIRSVAWDQSQNGGFVFVLRPGPAVDRMAHNFVGFVQVRD